MDVGPDRINGSVGRPALAGEPALCRARIATRAFNQKFDRLAGCSELGEVAEGYSTVEQPDFFGRKFAPMEI